MPDTCTCQNACSSCGPSECACGASNKCSCQNCVNKAIACSCDGANECICAKEGKTCSCGK